jgi:DNA helicase II / ATP-dependent DNA helicase PcrA
MPEPTCFKPPIITDEDVEWVCARLRLPTNAFGGMDGRDPRRAILKSTDTLDIEACPGSGKTTLLVAKLAILSRKWVDACRGICVLSHTNSARREIERALGNTVEGRRLLSYPHFVGTIHTFANQFLALPWLRSLGFPVRVIDDQFCEGHRRHLLTLHRFQALRSTVKNKEDYGKNINVVKGWRTVSPLFVVEPEFKNSHCPASKQRAELAELCVKDGYYCHDEMLMWGNSLLNSYPEICGVIRKRFPMLFIDEVQDNSEKQSALLSSLFIEGESAVKRQRFGDSNQAIYQHAGETDGATTDMFPVLAVRKDIPGSLRFGQEIAGLADPLGLVPQGLHGHGPRRDTVTSETDGKHAIFLFGNAEIHRVLAAYAEYLEEVFSEKDLRAESFIATAIGAVHTQGEDRKMFPRSVGDYWPQYDSELSRTEPTPSAFCEYVTAGRGRALSEKNAPRAIEAHHVVEAIATGVLRLVRLLNPTAEVGTRRRKHRRVLELLTDNSEQRASYLEIVAHLAIEGTDPSKDEWEKRWSGSLCKIAEAIAGLKSDAARANHFLAWGTPEAAVPQVGEPRHRDNVFRHPSENPKISIRVGSIHSSKGQTHTATLVLETPNYGHHLATLKPWLLGERMGKGVEGIRNISRLKQHYVAMTRPTHLLCLAMKEDSFALNEIDTLKNKKGWRVARVSGSGITWI